ncbi:MAG TPA: DPP IV N-terminal domain-containing protein [Acidimicrobiales bacterium]|jgi:dipeptidyl-peptidase 4|nr:DPP IV N-terminal domain-containing protein [Acidimicrobiales bacterium]
MDVTDVAHYPLPGTVVPGSISFAPLGREITWLHSEGGDLTRQLYAVDIESGERRVVMGSGGGVDEADLTLEEKLRRERARELNVGVTSYAWADDAPVLLVPMPDGLHVGPIDALRLAVPNDGGSPMLDPRLSRDGSRVAWVRDDEVWVAPADGSAPPRQVTFGARDGGVTHGLADFISQEEMDQPRGYWWSPNGDRLAFLEVDESHIPVLRLPHADGSYEDHRYPFAGAENPQVRVGVVSAAGTADAEPLWLDLPEHEYVARVDWLADERLVVQLQDRRQQRLDVVAVDVTSGATTTLVTETTDAWINLHSFLRPIGDDRFLWASERSGYLHLEVRDATTGDLVTQLTNGGWVVTGVKAIDDRHVWFTATADSPLERHLYVVAVEGGEPQRLTTGAGTHDVVVDPASGRFVDTWSSLDTPPTVGLCRLGDGSPERVLHESRDPRIDVLDLDPPDLTTVTAADGTTELHVALYRPEGDGPFPTVVSVYGGPHAQRVTNSWLPTVRMRDQYLRSLGYLVVAVDNRGSAARGLAFEAALRHDAGSVEVDDQVAALRQLADRGLVDIDRGVAVHGWSYGGYMSAMCLAKAPDVFAVAVAGAPVTHWDGYDTHYTERYMGLPDENADGYERSSVMAHVEGMRGRHLMLVHGMIDENVHFRHTARLVNALIEARIPYELLLFPDERHLPRKEADRVYMEDRISDFITTHLPVA